MKQFVQNMKVFRTMPGRFLSVAVVLAAIFTFTPRAQADPGKGAVVTFITREGNLVFTTYTEDGLKVEIVFGAPGDFIRANPDGTLTIKVTATQVPMTISVPGETEGEWIPAWVGSGLFHSTDVVESTADGWVSTGEAGHQSYQFQLTGLADGSEWSLHALVVVVDYEVKVFNIDFHPK
jgi:hypothetical protein